jgi:predicted MFS family arabinose efflux permease
MHNNFAILKDPEYAKYASASVLTAIGSGMSFIAMSWFLFKLTGSALAIGWILVIFTLPGILFSPWIGAFVDRWNAKVICVGADVARGAIFLLVSVAMYYERLTLELVYLSTFLVAICDNFFQPAVAALIRDTAPRDQLLQANVLSNMSMQIGGLGGASAGGLLVVDFGPAVVVFVNGVSFLVSAVLTFWIQMRHERVRVVDQVVKPSFIRDFKESYAYLQGTGFVVWLAVQQMFVYVTLYICNTLLPVFVDRELHAGAAGFGIIDAAWGVGALYGGLSLSYLATRVSPRYLSLGGLMLMAVSLIVFLTAGSVSQASLAYAGLGFLACIIRINTDTILVSNVDPVYFGRVKASIAMFISYVSLAVYLAVGFAGDKMSVRYIYLAVSVVILVAVVAALARSSTAGAAQPAYQPDAAPD